MGIFVFRHLLYVICGLCTEDPIEVNPGGYDFGCPFWFGVGIKSLHFTHFVIIFDTLVLGVLLVLAGGFRVTVDLALCVFDQCLCVSCCAMHVNEELY